MYTKLTISHVCMNGNESIAIYTYIQLMRNACHMYLPMHQFQLVGFGSEFALNCPTFAAAVQSSSCAVSASLGVYKPVVLDQEASLMIEYPYMFPLTIQTRFRTCVHSPYRIYSTNNTPLLSSLPSLLP